MRIFFSLVLICLVVGASGCTPVKAWEKRHLARSHMALDPDPLESRMMKHVYQSKEGTSGGYGVGGGGCGCS